MYKIVIGSLMAGAGAIFLWLVLLNYPPVSSDFATTQWSWDRSTGSSKVGTGSATESGWQMTLDAAGRGVVVIPLPSLAAAQYPSLHLRLSALSQTTALGIFWRTIQTGEQMPQYWVPGAIDESLWLPMEGLDVWAGDLLEIAILVQGDPGAETIIEAVELLPGSAVNRGRTVFSDWNAFVPWGMASINRFAATRLAGATVYPVALAATLLAASLLAYGILLLLPTGVRVDLRVVACIFLFCWIGLDLSWQRKLWLQLELTREQFAGKDSQARLESGPDAALVQFMTYVQRRVEPPDARIFVGSRADYAGMRGSYYLYPRNVYWRRHAAELPDRKYIRPGDYIVLIYPTEVQFDPQLLTLLAPDGEPVAVRLLAEAGVGSLYRVM